LSISFGFLNKYYNFNKYDEFETYGEAEVIKMKNNVTFASYLVLISM